jgi:hypothetical protein
MSREIGCAMHVLISDLVLELLKGNLLLALVWVIKGSIPVQPLAIGDSPQLLEETSHPLVGCFVGLQVLIVMSVDHFPASGWKGKQKVVLPNHILGQDSSTNFRGEKQWGQRSVGEAKAI